MEPERPVKRMTLLVGPPGCGKSGAARRLMAEGALRITGDDVFFAITDRTHGEWLADGVMNAVNASMDFLLAQLMDRGLDVVVDRTHLSPRKREVVLKLAREKGYQVSALCWLNFDQARGRNAARVGRDKVPQAIWDRMCAAFEAPQKEEGIEQIINVVDASGRVLDPIADRF